MLKVNLSPREILEEHEEMAVQAEKILRQNDMGVWTRAASGLYPHQWSWVSAFKAIGLAHLDVRRAARERWPSWDRCLARPTTSGGTHLKSYPTP
jgi:hypothetical protein